MQPIVFIFLVLLGLGIYKRDNRFFYAAGAVFLIKAGLVALLAAIIGIVIGNNIIKNWNKQ